MKPTNKLLCGLATAFLAASGAANSADIMVLNFDDPDVGFNDQTPADPVGGNPGMTLGEQRLNVFAYAAQILGAQLKSTQPIYLAAFFGPLTCSPTSGVLGSAGPASVFADFPRLPLPGTWYVGALADSLERNDLDPGYVDMIARFNGDIGVNPDCLTGQSWYNGLDNNNDPNSEIDLLTVVLHEMSHGLGFLELADEATGELFFGFPDAYLVNMYDIDTGKHWDEMSDAERLASQVNSNQLVWTGEQVTLRSQYVLGPRPSVVVTDPPEIEGSYEAQIASFGPMFPEIGSSVSGRFKIARDEVPPRADGCEPITNNVRHRIAIIDRGTCTFTQKVANAQAAEAKAVIIVNNAPSGLPPMGGADPTITIVSVGVSMADGALFKAAASDFDLGTTGRIKYDKAFKAGTTNGLVRLYAPNPVSPGSSKSHFDISATPNLLMEPFINDDLTPVLFLDLTPRVFKDIGWKLQ
jgi:PA domain